MRIPALNVVLVAVLFLHLPGSGPAHAGDDAEAARVRLLVECDAEVADRVRAALAGLPVQVFEVVPATGGAGPESAPREPAYGGLPSAHEAMTAIYAALAEIDREALGGHFVIERMSVQARRASLRIVADTPAAIDHARAALAASPDIRGRARDPERVVEMGTVTRQGERVRAELSLPFRTRDGEPVGARRDVATGIAMASMAALATQAGLRQVRASAERRDANRRAGVVQVSREYTYEETALSQFLALVAAVDQRDDLTVFELRWQLDERAEGGARIRKPTMKVGYWAPLER